MVKTELTAYERARYAHHLALPGFGEVGQQQLKASSVLIVGAGGLGSPVALYLAAAGVGRIGIVDDDVVDVTNLQRQVIHNTAAIGTPKVHSARNQLVALNPQIQVDTYRKRLTSANAATFISRYDVVVDGSDNFDTRYLINDACIAAEKPDVHASVYHYEGQLSVFGYRNGPCYSCLYPEAPDPLLLPSCSQGGVLGVVPGIMGMLQATEVIKILTGLGTPLSGRLLLVDVLALEIRTIQLARNPDCPCCGTSGQQSPVAGIAGGKNQMFGFGKSTPEITVAELREKLAKGEKPFILDVREPDEYARTNMGGVLIPLGELAGRVDELEAHRDATIVVHCHSGSRSARAVQYLRGQGFEGAVNLKGGIAAWCRP